MLRSCRVGMSRKFGLILDFTFASLEFELVTIFASLGFEMAFILSSFKLKLAYVWDVSNPLENKITTELIVFYYRIVEPLSSSTFDKEDICYTRPKISMGPYYFTKPRLNIGHFWPKSWPSLAKPLNRPLKVDRLLSQRHFLFSLSETDSYSQAGGGPHRSNLHSSILFWGINSVTCYVCS